MAYENLPDTLMTAANANTDWEAKIKATGFQLLYYKFWPKQVGIDISKSNLLKSEYFLTASELSRAFEAELAGNVRLLEFEDDTLFLEVYQVVSKKVPIQPDIHLELAPNHLLEGELLVEPTEVTLKGPKNEVAPIREIKTAKIRLVDVTSEFTQKTNLVKSEGLKNSELLVRSVTISGDVVRFSEKVFEVDITVDNLPKGFQAKTFPKKVPVLCKASIERLKVLSVKDFQVFVDTEEVDKESTVLVRIQKRPDGVYDVRLLENRVKFILEEE